MADTMTMRVPYQIQDDTMNDPFRTAWPTISTSNDQYGSVISPKSNQMISRAPSIQRYTTASSRWSALVNRDHAATSAFIYAVLTTKIYCRPDCSSRLARRANVRFYDTAAQAEQAGFRACKRCKPERERKKPTNEANSSPASTPSLTNASTPSSNNDEDEQEDARSKIERAVKLVHESASEGKVISLADLSAQVKLSKFHLQRVFKKLQGLTPREMAEGIIKSSKQETSMLAQQGQPRNQQGTFDSSLHDFAFSDFDTWQLPLTDTFALDARCPSADDCMMWPPNDAEYVQLYHRQQDQEHFMKPPFILDNYMGMDFQVPENDVLMDLFPELYGGGPKWKDT